MALVDLLHQCLRYFVHLDESNAAVHTAPVRYSPITFRLAEELMAHLRSAGEWPAEDDGTVVRVLSHVGQYEEDRGR